MSISVYYHIKYTLSIAKCIFYVLLLCLHNSRGVNLDTLNNILELLKKNKKTQKQLTDYLGLSQNVFTEWKSNRNSSYIKHIPKIAEFFNVSTDYLLGRENKKTESTLLAYSGNEKVDSIVKTLLNSSIDDDDLKIIEVVLDKYKK